MVRGGGRRRVASIVVGLVVAVVGLAGCYSTPGDVAGTVRDTGGAVQAGIEATLYRPDGTVVAATASGVDGSYRFEDVGPSYDLRLGLHDPTGTYFDWWHAGAYGLGTATPIEVGDGATTVVDAVLLTSTTTTSITGTVTAAATGDPAFGVGVEVLLAGDARHPIAVTTTESDGTYFFSELGPGDYLVRFSGGGYGTLYQGGARSIGTASPVSLAAGDHEVVDAVLDQAGAFNGFVLPDEFAGAVPGLHVAAFVRDDLEHPVAVTVTGSDGRYHLTSLPPGELIVGVVDGDDLAAGRGFAPMTAGTPRVVDPIGATGFEVVAGVDRQLEGIRVTGADCGPPTIPSSGPVSLDGLDLSGARFAGCRMPTSLVGTDLSGADLDRAMLAISDLSGADLRGARLTALLDTSSNFQGADLTGADARGARFSFLDLLAPSNFTGADFTDADLTGATFGHSNLAGAIFSNTTCPDGVNSGPAGGTCLGHLIG